MIGVLVGLFFLICIVAGMAIALAYMLDVVLRRLGSTIRSFFAALGSACFIFLGGAWFVAVPDDGSILVAILPVIIGSIILGLLIGFPAALWFSRRRERSRGATSDPSTFE